MKNLIALLLASGLLAHLAHSQDAGTNAMPAKPLTAEESATYARMVRSEVELSAQLKVLSDLADDLLKRAADAKPAQPDQARAQTDLAQELRNRASTRLKDLNQLTSDRLAWETAHGPAKPASLGVGALEQAKPLNADEFAFMTKVDERTLAVRQELSAALEYGKTFSLELSTNTSPEAVTRISAMVDNNNAVVRTLEREQSDLELKKLQFRALRR